jgi:DALR anticodon binding domain
LALKRGHELEMDFSKMVLMDEYSGIYLAGCLWKLKRRLSESTIEEEDLAGVDYLAFEKHFEYADVLRVLTQFPGVAQLSFKALESSTIMAYLFRLVDQMAAVWELEDGDECETAKIGVPIAFYQCVLTVLENGLKMLGINTEDIQEPEAAIATEVENLEQVDGKDVANVDAGEIPQEAQAVPALEGGVDESKPAGDDDADVEMNGKDMDVGGLPAHTEEIWVMVERGKETD